MTNVRYLLMYEGSAERAICEILIENNLLHFSKEMMLEERGIQGLTYEAICPLLNYSLSADGIDTVRIYRIKDKKQCNFKMGKVHRDLIRMPVDILTRPEIEMLYIISQGKYEDYVKANSQQKGTLSPSSYIKNVLRCRSIKYYPFVREYFSNIELLINAINRYHRMHSDEITLWDILKENYDERKIWQ